MICSDPHSLIGPIFNCSRRYWTHKATTMDMKSIKIIYWKSNLKQKLSIKAINTKELKTEKKSIKQIDKQTKKTTNQPSQQTNKIKTTQTYNHINKQRIVYTLIRQQIWIPWDLQSNGLSNNNNKKKKRRSGAQIGWTGLCVL